MSSRRRKSEEKRDVKTFAVTFQVVQPVLATVPLSCSSHKFWLQARSSLARRPYADVVKEFEAIQKPVIDKIVKKLMKIVESEETPVTSRYVFERHWVYGINCIIDSEGRLESRTLRIIGESEYRDVFPCIRSYHILGMFDKIFSVLGLSKRYRNFEEFTIVSSNVIVDTSIIDSALEKGLVTREIARYLKSMHSSYILFYNPDDSMFNKLVHDPENVVVLDESWIENFIQKYLDMEYFVITPPLAIAEFPFKQFLHTISTRGPVTAILLSEYIPPGYCITVTVSYARGFVWEEIDALFRSAKEAVEAVEKGELPRSTVVFRIGARRTHEFGLLKPISWKPIETKK